ncbi:ABC transporter substrate-binding protein [Microbacterium panaciterrae]|uniref:Solute-binding protein family 3/N-terminal domain-containing protein n=1 Tax=Microbacterium panaciterrae TaxID=985759 RepID=A0ABP8PME9_9MICO
MKKTLIGLIAATALILTGCSSGPAPSTAPETKGAKTPITVAVVPVADVAPLYLGVEKGFFAEEGLDITIKNVQGAAAAVPLLLNGEMQFAYGALIPVISVAASGVPVTFVVGGIAKPPSAKADYSAIVTKQGSSIKDLKGLAGHSVAVNALRGGPHLSVILALKKAGVDPSTVNFVELPMSDGMAAVQRGDVDAAYLAEPFTSQAVAAGLPVISSPVYETAPDGATSGYFAVRPYLDQHASTADAFARAIAKSDEYANGHLDEVRAQIVKYSGMDAKTVENMRIPTFTSKLEASSITAMAGQMDKLGWLTARPDAAGMVR